MFNREHTKDNKKGSHLEVTWPLFPILPASEKGGPGSIQDHFCYQTNRTGAIQDRISKVKNTPLVSGFLGLHVFGYIWFLVRVKRHWVGTLVLLLAHLAYGHRWAYAITMRPSSVVCRLSSVVCRKLFQKSSPLKLLNGFSWNFVVYP